MARRSRPGQRMRTPQRGHTPTASHRLSEADYRIRPVDLRAFEDRRLYVPDPRPQATRTRWPSRLEDLRSRFPGARRARILEAPRGKLRDAIDSLGMKFEAPKKVLICVRRKQRREVLHAKKRLRGSGSKRRNRWSDVKC